MTDSPNAQALLADSDLIHSAEAVAAAVDRVAGEIAGRLRGSHPLLLCVMNGGVPFAGRLMMRLDFPLDFDYVHATRYGRETAGGEIEWRAWPRTPLEGRTVLLVDDILDEGHTLAAIAGRVRERGAAACLTAVAVDKLNGLEKPLRADFTALTAPNRFLFGFGMDARGLWRNLPSIHAMKEN
ncbi:MAG: hypoxanthine-guanine phosphoribosyltransferase [Candidatus Accumulibacter sp.]|jgi:hypoxanthine phosphoribosyltransferase|nr:hypoxanthine-guanine phosphoribosyltransferase [Accumulibacter sp.]